MPIQVRSKAHSDLHKTEIYAPEMQAFPLGLSDVFNGQFDFWRNGMPVDWEIAYMHATSFFSQQTGGAAGNYCIRGGNTAANQRGTTVIQRAYMPVGGTWHAYNLYGTFRGSAAGCTYNFGVKCYDAAKAFLSNVLIDSAVAPGVNWAGTVQTLGFGGTAFAANTRYVRVFADLQYAQTQAAGAYIEMDDVTWRPEP